MRLSPLILLSLATAVPASGQQQQAGDPRPRSPINIPYERYTLPNGLTVILSVNRATPTVTVDVWYHVGSKNEVAGRSGFAHLFEHVMFTGSGHVPYGLHDRMTEGVGGNNNGSTSHDRTNYFQNIPSNYLETLLWIEADRMGFLLDALDSAKFVAQRDIVQNERRQGVDNQPYGRAHEIMLATMFPAGHPYSWDVIGSMNDLLVAPLEDVKSFFRQYYAPNNATLAIVGDFDPAQAKQLVARYFADIPRGKRIERPKVPQVTLGAERRLLYEDRVQVPRLYVRWPAVGLKHDDRFALQVLGSILAGPRTARLTKALVYDRQSAAFVSAGLTPNEDVGFFSVTVTPRPGHTLASIEATVDSLIERFKAEGPSADELKRATAGAEYNFVSFLESNFGRAETVLQGSVFFDDPGYFRRALAKIQAVTATDVKRVANTYLSPGRVVLSVVPTGKPELGSKPEASTKVSSLTTTSQSTEAK
ncbi:MAG: M16 family metallopeptidase [Gemmatimonadaceae bacterium]